MAFLTLEGMEVYVLPGTEIRDTAHGDFARAYSGKMRSDRRASHREGRVLATFLDTADEAPALRTILNTPGPIKFGGTLIGDDAYFHVRNVQFAPVRSDLLSFSFDCMETDDSPSPLLFSFDGDAPGSYTHTRSGSIGPVTDADGVLRLAAPNVLRREYLWTEGTYSRPTLPDTPGYLIEAARTNLVSNDDVSTWSVIGGSPVLTAVSDPAGGSGAYRIEDNNGSNQTSVYSQGFTFTNGIKGFAIDVREATMPASGNQQVAVITGGAAGRCVLTITGWTNGRPSITETTGTYLGMRYVGNGFWRLYGQTITVQAGTHHVLVIPAVTSSETGSIEIYRANVYDVEQPGWSILNAGETRNAETLTAPFTARPQSMSGYVRFVEGDIDAGQDQAGIVELGTTTAFGASDAWLNIYRDDRPTSPIGYYGITHRSNATAGYSVVATVDLSPVVIGDDIELFWWLSSTGTVKIAGRKNSGAITTSTESGDNALSYSWASPTARIGWSGYYASPAGMVVRSIKVFRGIQTTAYLEDAANGRLHPRTADAHLSTTETFTATAAGSATTTAIES